MNSSAPNHKSFLAALRTNIRGEVRFDNGSRALYSTDASNYRQIPIGVVIPRDIEDMVETIAICNRYDAPVLNRGGGTSLAGQCCNVAVVIDTSKHINKVLEVKPDHKIARVEPGAILDTLRAAAEVHGLTFGPDPATHNRCTMGGMIGNNSCGVHSVMAGSTMDNVEELEILTFEGLRIRVGKTDEIELKQIIEQGGRLGAIYARLESLRNRYAELIRDRFPRIPRRVSGYNLDQLLPENGFNVARALVGTEGTCVTFLEASVRLVHSPPARSLLVIAYPDIYEAADHVVEVLRYKPIGLEGMDDRALGHMKKKAMVPAERALFPAGGGCLLVEFGGATKEESMDLARKLMVQLRRGQKPPAMRLFGDANEAKAVWRVRESALGGIMRVPGEKDNWEGWEDAAVPPEKLGHYLRDFQKLVDKYDYSCALYGHFGQGCVHNRLDFDLKTQAGIKTFRSFLEEAAELVVSYGGSISGEHGDGQARAELLPKMFGEELVQAFREFKTIWDPKGKMNPGKVVNPYRVDENLRLGTTYQPLQTSTHFKFPDDGGSLADATLRCVGVGACRRESGGTMCPSYMVTRDEKHSTRGRAHLLFEMFQGEVISGEWRDRHVKEAMDLCLACKACKSECPVQVDMASYKAEFLSHYYKGRLRPRAAYTMGLIPWWSRIAAQWPRTTNILTQTTLLSRIAKVAAGIAPERQIPAFATQTFKKWFFKRGTRNEGKPEVILWPDTFTNHFRPDISKAAVEVLEAIGYRVHVPRQSLCCGRPLYDWGMLDLAKSLLRQILQTLKPQIAAGVPIVGLEPSCVTVFRDELVNLFPHDENAKRLSLQTFLLSEFLESERGNYRFPEFKRKALVHGHCHQRAIMGMAADEAVLGRLGVDFQLLDSGCCGMAGAFGFEKRNYEISLQAGERVLLPAVRDAAEDNLIIASGFSCSEQIAQSTDRMPLHLAEVIRMALGENTNQPSIRYVFKRVL